MPEDTLEKLRARRDTLNERIRRKEGRMRAELYRQDTRKKILVGAMTMERAERDPLYMAALLKELSAFLTRPGDRALFNLPTPALPDVTAAPVPAWPQGGTLDQLDPADQPGH